MSGSHRLPENKEEEHGRKGEKRCKVHGARYKNPCTMYHVP